MDFTQRPWYKPGNLAYDFINCCGDITRHPMIETHVIDVNPNYKDSSIRTSCTESAEMLVRYLINMTAEEVIRGFHLFTCSRPKGLNISVESDGLLITTGDVNGHFPETEYCILREENNCLSLECSYTEVDNIFGFTADVNEDDWEEVAYYVFFKLTFISESHDDLPDSVKVLDYVPTRNFSEVKWIVKDPFGLNGYFLFEKKLDYETIG